MFKKILSKVLKVVSLLFKAVSVVASFIAAHIDALVVKLGA